MKLGDGKFRSMAGRWSSKSQFKALVSALEATERKEFERAVLPLFRLISPDVQLAQGGGSLDRAAGDLYGGYSHSDQKWDIVVQCKGFEVLEQELGSDQISQCRKSINAFKKQAGKLRAKRFVLVYNRDGRNRTFEQKVQTLLQELPASQQVDSAELLNLPQLLEISFEAIYQKLRVALPTLTAQIQHDYTERTTLPGIRITDVPFRHGSFRFNQLEFTAPTYQESSLSDPLKAITQSPTPSRTDITFVLGEFGLGKTTLALRYAEREQRPALFFPAALIPKNVTGAKDLLSRALLNTPFFSDVEPRFADTYRKLIQPAAERLFLDKGTPITLVIDGVDESPLLARKGGGATLFDVISVPRIPVVVTMRMEFWECRRLEIAKGFEGRAKPKRRSVRNQTVQIVELERWGNEQILELIKHSAAAVESKREHENLVALSDLVLSGNYQTLYGDIPRRPLFLTMLIEHVQKQGVHETGRATLLLQWTQRKIRRDIQPGRIGIARSSEAADTTEKLALAAMQLAADAMTTVEENQLVLLPDCALDPLLSADPRFAQLTDPTGLFLNSLLLPLPQLSSVQSRRIRFAHRAFQDFFLAIHLKKTAATGCGISIPSEISEWMRAIAAERLLN